MAREQITAPVDPSAQQATRLRDLATKGARRTPAEAAEAIDLLAARVTDLEARLDAFAAGR